MRLAARCFSTAILALTPALCKAHEGVEHHWDDLTYLVEMRFQVVMIGAVLAIAWIIGRLSSVRRTRRTQ